ncbi:Host specificity protein J [Escherichia coli]|uniref:Host specificity protein J n=1 Tax=Escherichia coli TaxID=562 RepID=A0A377A5T7_ECOLX|nr:Host specificity protein J [Escherichia coli]STM35613.1 Host specificity protein J [Escherichia coli]
MVASGAVCGDAFPGNGLPVRGLWSLIPVLVAFPLILCQQPPVTDRLPRHSIRISSNRGCIVFYCAGSGVRFPARLHRLNQIQQG